MFAALSALASVTAVPVATNPYKVIFHLENLEREGKGDVVVMVHPEWAPVGAERFAELVEQRYFDGNRFFRVVCGFVAQFGISADPKVNAEWKGKTIRDDPEILGVHNTRGKLSFFTDGDKDDRNTQIVFNIKDNEFLDDKGYVPFAEVVDGIFFVDRIYNKYGGSQKAPDQSKLEAEGEEYAVQNFPLLSKIASVEVVKPDPPAIFGGGAYLFCVVVAASVFIIIGLFGGGWNVMMSNK